MVIMSKWQDGFPILAIPNFARMNRVGPPHDYPDDRDHDPKRVLDSKYGPNDELCIDAVSRASSNEMTEAAM
jgi:hypothetical protein